VLDGWRRPHKPIRCGAPDCRPENKLGRKGCPFPLRGLVGGTDELSAASACERQDSRRWSRYGASRGRCTGTASRSR